MPKSKIEWTDRVWNPVTGCTKVSQGCKNCYAEVIANRFWKDRKFTDVQCHPDRLEQPLHWRKPATVFVNSMSDLFHEDVSVDFIARVFAIMFLAEKHTFQILTKRPERAEILTHKSVIELIAKYTNTYHDKYIKPLESEMYFDEEIISMYPFKNVWLGVSVEDQKTADERIPLLLQIPAAVRFLSCEPLLGEIDLSKWVTVHKVKPVQRWFYAKCNTCGYIGSSECFEGGYPLADTGDYSDIECPKCNSLAIDDNVPDPLHWLICGGESGHGARPMHPDWARKLRDDCHTAGVPFFFKQWGEWGIVKSDLIAKANKKSMIKMHYNGYSELCHEAIYNSNGLISMARRGKKYTGRLLDGVEHNEMPEIINGEGK